MKIESEILCIHYYFPPIRSGGVLRNYFFAKAFCQVFDSACIVSTSNVDVMEQEKLLLPSNCSLYYAKTSDFRSIKRAENHIKESTKKSLAFKIFSKLHKTLPFHFYIGEGGIKYIKNSVQIASELIENKNITHIYSSFMPYADHKIASILKEKYPNLIWIADFRDLQNEPIYKNIYFPKLNTYLERKILKQANLVTTISDGLANTLKSIHPHVISVPRGIEMIKSYNTSLNSKSEIFTISYTGNLFQNFRDGAFFVKAFATAIIENEWSENQVRFIYAGRDNDAWVNWFKSKNIEKYLVCRGFISRPETRKIQESSNCLLLLSSSSEEQKGVLTGKLFEYLETENPILNVINGVKDEEFETIFRELEAGYIYYPAEENKLVHDLGELYRNFENNTLKGISDKAFKARENLSWDARIKQMLNAL